VNEVAFILGTVVAISYYFYTKRKEQACRKQQNGQEEENTPNQPKGGDNQ
jgi:hypothetical protein